MPQGGREHWRPPSTSLDELTPVDEQHSNQPVWRTRHDVLYRELVDGGLVYDSRTRQVHHLNAAAALIWQACREGRSARDLAAALCERFQVDETTARADVASVLAALTSEDLVIQGTV